MPETIAVYARVSTTAQNPQRQLDHLREYTDESYPGHQVEEFVDIVSGTATSSEEYDRLWAQINTGTIERVVVDEISRISRLGGGEVLEFIEHCLDNETSVEDREVGLTIDVTDDIVDQAVTELLISVMGQLAKIEHKQKLRRIRSGIRSAQEVGKWTGRPPVGFETDEDGYLRVDPEEFLRCREAIERVLSGETRTTVADDLGLPSSTVGKLVSDRRDLYLKGDTDDDRVAEAVEDIEPLPETDVESTNSDEQIRKIVREELDSFTDAS